jgi:dienelactone hydrolase
MPEASAAQTVTLETPGGPMQGQLYVPNSEGKHGAVIVIPEAFGLTPGITIECQRLAEEGYLALGIEIFHRSAPAGWTPTKPDFSEAMPHFRVLTNQGLAEDLAAAKAFLARHPASNGKLRTSRLATPASTRRSSTTAAASSTRGRTSRASSSR